MSNLPGFFEGTEMPTAGWWEALWPDPSGVLVAVGVKPGMEVIDLCSGDGWFTLQIAMIARHVVAIDIDGGMLDLARRRLLQNRVANYELVQGDAFEIRKLAPRPAPLSACGQRYAQSVRQICDRELACAPARGDHRSGGAARAENRLETVAAADHQGSRGGWIEIRSTR
jgi:Methyltransferase domain